jgi:hypothetical protein
MGSQYPNIRGMFRRKVFTVRPPSGDYLLSSTGFTWSIGRSNADGSRMQMTTGERDKNVALATLLMLADRDRTDAWEAEGTGSYWLVKRHRADSAMPSSST